MKKTIDKLAFSNIRQNRSRSMLVILSIFLTTLLLTAIADFGCGLVRYNRQNVGYIYGRYCGTFGRVTEEQYQTLKQRGEFTHVGKSAYTAQVDPGQEGQGVHMSLTFLDVAGAENVNISNTLQMGGMPMQKNEITASPEFFAYLGLSDPKLGDTVSVSYRRDSQSAFEEQEFVISGVQKSQKGTALQKAFQGYVSQEFYESLYPQELRSYAVTFRLDESVDMIGDKEEILQELGALCGIEKENVSPNTGYLIWAYDPGMETILGCIGIALVVIVVSVAVIYNIFQVGIVQKIQEYGKIKALGGTKKQMRKLIFREGMMLSAVGIPLGLLLGTAAASLLFQKLILESEMAQSFPPIKVSIVSLPLLLAVVLAALVTVILSLFRPMRIAARISPVEAIRYQENTGRKRQARKGKKRISVMGLTMSVMSQNRRRTISTICTMGLSCVLFVVLCNLAGNLDNEFEVRRRIEYGQFSVELDWSLNDTVYQENNLFQIQKKNPLGAEFQEKLKAIPGVTEVRSRKVFGVENDSFSNKDQEGGRTSVCVLDREGFQRYGKGSTLGTVDYDQVKEADGILFGYSYFLEDYGYELGQQVEWTDLMDSRANYQGTLMGAFGSAPASWVITEDTFRKLGISDDVTEKVWVDCKERDKEQVEASIQELLEGVSHVETDSYDNAMKSVRAGSGIMQSMIYTFLGLLGVIAFFNMANTIITQVTARKRELGVLQAVGMTNRQLNQMLQMEGFLFSVGTTIISLVIGTPLGYLLFQYAKEKHYYGINEYHFPVLEIGVMVLVILLLQAGLSFLLSRNLRRESLVERIKYQG